MVSSVEKTPSRGGFLRSLLSIADMTLEPGKFCVVQLDHVVGRIF
jgi:hypothetical protein